MATAAVVVLRFVVVIVARLRSFEHETRAAGGRTASVVRPVISTHAGVVGGRSRGVRVVRVRGPAERRRRRRRRRRNGRRPSTLPAQYQQVRVSKYHTHKHARTHTHTHTHTTQPCIPPGSLNPVPASAGVRAGMSPQPGGR